MRSRTTSRSTGTRWPDTARSSTASSNVPLPRASAHVVPSRTNDAHAYRVHAWRDPQLEREMIANGFVSIGGNEIGDLTGVTDAETIRDWLTESMLDRSPRAISLFVGYWRRFLWEAEPGDLVVLPTRTRDVAIGEFVGPYHFVRSAEPHARHRRAVSWIASAVDRDAFDADLVTTLNGQHTVQEFKAATRRQPAPVARRDWRRPRTGWATHERVKS